MKIRHFFIPGIAQMIYSTLRLMAVILCVAMLPFGTSFAQSKSMCAFSKIDGKYVDPSEKLRKLKLAPGSFRYRRLVKRIRELRGYPHNINVNLGSTDNALAISSRHRGAETIVYNPFFMQYLKKLDRKWAEISVLAHEVGHIADPQGIGRGWESELAADRYSGCVLAKMGASLEDALFVEKVFFRDKLNGSHPPSPKRISAIRESFNECR